MKKLLILLPLSVSLSGCIWQTVSAVDVKNAAIICEAEKANVATISSHWIGHVSVECDSARVYPIGSRVLQEAKDKLKNASLAQ